MNDARAMRAFYRISNLGENTQRVVARQASLDPQSLGERRAAHIAHDEVPDAADFAERVQRQDSRMRELRRNARLATESLASLLGERELGP